jgi:hypothetical protein
MLGVMLAVIGSAQMVREAKANKIVHIKRSNTDRGANSSRFQSSIVGATREMAEGGDQFSRTAKKRVFKKQISKKIEAAGFEAGCDMDSWGRGH